MSNDLQIAGLDSAKAALLLQARKGLQRKQKFLASSMDTIVRQVKADTSRYSRRYNVDTHPNIRILRSGAHNSSIINQLSLSQGVMDFMEQSTFDQGQMVPHIEIYKVFTLWNGEEVEVRYNFRNATDFTNFETYNISPLKGPSYNGPDAGLQSIDMKMEGRTRNPFSAKLLDVTIKLFFQDVKTLFRPIPLASDIKHKLNAESFSYSDLIRFSHKPNERTDMGGASYRIKLKLGWATSPDNPAHQIAQTTRKTIMCDLRESDLEFDENGHVIVVAKYWGIAENSLGSVNILGRASTASARRASVNQQRAGLQQQLTTLQQQLQQLPDLSNPRAALDALREGIQQARGASRPGQDWVVATIPGRGAMGSPLGQSIARVHFRRQDKTIYPFTKNDLSQDLHDDWEMASDAVIRRLRSSQEWKDFSRDLSNSTAFDGTYGIHPGVGNPDTAGGAANFESAGLGSITGFEMPIGGSPDLERAIIRDYMIRNVYGDTSARRHALLDQIRNIEQRLQASIAMGNAQTNFDYLGELLESTHIYEILFDEDLQNWYQNLLIQTGNIQGIDDSTLNYQQARTEARNRPQGTSNGLSRAVAGANVGTDLKGRVTDAVNNAMDPALTPAEAANVPSVASRVILNLVGPSASGTAGQHLAPAGEKIFFFFFGDLINTILKGSPGADVQKLLGEDFKLLFSEFDYKEPHLPNVERNRKSYNLFWLPIEIGSFVDFLTTKVIGESKTVYSFLDFTHDFLQFIMSNIFNDLGVSGAFNNFKLDASPLELSNHDLNRLSPVVQQTPSAIELLLGDQTLRTMLDLTSANTSHALLLHAKKRAPRTVGNSNYRGNYIQDIKRGIFHFIAGGPSRGALKSIKFTDVKNEQFAVAVWRTTSGDDALAGSGPSILLPSKFSVKVRLVGNPYIQIGQLIYVDTKLVDGGYFIREKLSFGGYYTVVHVNTFYSADKYETELEGILELGDSSVVEQSVLTTIRDPRFEAQALAALPEFTTPFNNGQ